MDGMGTHKSTQRHGSVSGTELRNHHWPLLLIAAPAAVAIWSGWVGLASMCGFGIVRPLPGILDSIRIDTAITLPIGVESYGAYALWVWLSGRGGEPTRIWARNSAFAALGLGCLGQVAFHLLTAAHWTEAPWPVVVVVACLPVVTLAFAAALIHMTRTDRRAEDEAAAEAERAGAEAAARAEARATARAELPAKSGTRKRSGTAQRNRGARSAGTAVRKQAAAGPEPAAEPAAEPAPDETVGIDAEARILELIAEGHTPSEAGKLAGKSDSYGRQVARTARKLAETAPEGQDARTAIGERP